jgi:hypothetical protein
VDDACPIRRLSYSLLPPPFSSSYVPLPRGRRGSMDPYCGLLLTSATSPALQGRSFFAPPPCSTARLPPS